MRVELRIEVEPKDPKQTGYEPAVFTTSVEVTAVAQAAVQAIMVKAVSDIIGAELQAVQRLPANVVAAPDVPDSFPRLRDPAR